MTSSASRNGSMIMTALRKKKIIPAHDHDSDHDSIEEGEEDTSSMIMTALRKKKRIPAP